MRLMTIQADGGLPADCGRGRSDSLCACLRPTSSLGGRFGGGSSRNRRRTDDGAKEEEREGEGGFGSAIVTWYETRPPPFTTTGAAALAEDADRLDSGRFGFRPEIAAPLVPFPLWISDCSEARSDSSLPTS